jgi:hypothetical protein
MHHLQRWTLMAAVTWTLAACASPTEPMPEPLAGTWIADHHVTLCGHMDCMVFPERWTLQIEDDEQTARISWEWGPVAPSSCDGTMERSGQAVAFDLNDCGRLEGATEPGEIRVSGGLTKGAELTFRAKDLDRDARGG